MTQFKIQGKETHDSGCAVVFLIIASMLLLDLTARNSTCRAVFSSFCEAVDMLCKTVRT